MLSQNEKKVVLALVPRKHMSLFATVLLEIIAPKEAVMEGKLDKEGKRVNTRAGHPEYN